MKTQKLIHDYELALVYAFKKQFSATYRLIDFGGMV